MFRILVVFGSTYGQTERVAQRIASVLRAAGLGVDALKGDQLAGPLPLDRYDGFVIAASVLMGRHQAYIREFVRRHVDRLNAFPSAFVSVCGAAGDAPAEARRYVDGFLRETGWRPHLVRSFTGAVAYTRYAWWYRWYLKRISQRKGWPTDTSRDWDFTEWDEVDRFAGELATTLVPRPAPPVRQAVPILERGGSDAVA
jgi:menaquinone-dependent protoporphyrinogen oxidase